MFTHTFTVPSYYPLFSCKCGDCRQTCCHGWGISLSMTEYFRILGLSCSEKLRRKLDTAFHLADHPTSERYALVSHTWTGDCPIMTEDGWCGLQRECGEEAISSVCRYYPRSPKTAPIWECCTTAGCEETVELLFSDDKPISYTEMTLTFDLDEAPPSIDEHEAASRYAIRASLIEMLSDRSHSFDERLKKLLQKFFSVSAQSVQGDREKEVDPVLLMRDLNEQLIKTSVTLQELLPICEKIYAFDRPDSQKIQNLCFSSLRSNDPKWDIHMEKLFVNHLFYNGLPDAYGEGSFGGHGLSDTALALVMKYAFLKYLAAAYLENNAGEPEFDRTTAFADVIASAFKVIEHSAFDSAACRYLRTRQLTDPQILNALISF